MDKYRTLILKGNRNLGIRLKDLKLVDSLSLDKANDLLLKAVQNNDANNSNILKYLINDLNALDEKALLQASDFPLIDLRSYKIPHPSKLKVDPDLCRTTWTVPYGGDEGYLFVATAFNLSPPVIEHWENNTDDKIIWYTTDLENINYAFKEIAKIEESN